MIGNVNIVRSPVVSPACLRHGSPVVSGSPSRMTCLQNLGLQMSPQKFGSKSWSLPSALVTTVYQLHVRRLELAHHMCFIKNSGLLLHLSAWLTMEWHLPSKFNPRVARRRVAQMACYIGTPLLLGGSQTVCCIGLIGPFRFYMYHWVAHRRYATLEWPLPPLKFIGKAHCPIKNFTRKRKPTGECGPFSDLVHHGPITPEFRSWRRIRLQVPSRQKCPV